MALVTHRNIILGQVQHAAQEPGRLKHPHFYTCLGSKQTPLNKADAPSGPVGRRYNASPVSGTARQQVAQWQLHYCALQLEYTAN
jgi:hypothetical protein